MVQVYVQDVSLNADVPGHAEIKQWAKTTLRECEYHDVELTIRVVDEPAISALNQRFRSKKGSTNVLAFPFVDPPGLNTNLIGDVVVCAPVIAREAKHSSQSLIEHWAHIVVHGVLHLCGYDHQRHVEAQTMQQVECAVLKQLGFSDPYAEPTIAIGTEK